MSKAVTLKELWELSGFEPNPNQKKAIEHIEGPLFLTAGPGSGKTKVLLWRTLNLIVFHGIKPEEIYLSTFTEKAAKQLKDGLRGLLGMVTNKTGQPYDISRMAVGTIHSNCRKMLGDRNFSKDKKRLQIPSIMDELSQYFKIYNKQYWSELCIKGGFKDEEEAIEEINRYFEGRCKNSKSRHCAVVNIIGLFNRFSEECLEPTEVETEDETLSKILEMYKAYIEDLESGPIKQVDLSLLQKKAYEQISSWEGASRVYKHIIIDEYQDTNAIQEKIFFTLAKGYKNICVVGDDDQALYRFRGATVENLVEFEKKCEEYLGLKPERIDLDINYRSRKKIVDTYTTFIDIADWKKEPPLTGYYRVHDKEIKAHSDDEGPSVVVSSHTFKDVVYREVAEFVYQLKKSGKIEDYSQCAFLFPAMKRNTRVEGYKKAFASLNEKYGLTGTKEEIKIYAPRAGRFLELEETMAVWGLMLKIFGMPSYGTKQTEGLKNFIKWMRISKAVADKLCREDPMLAEFVKDRQKEIRIALEDYEVLMRYAEDNSIDIKNPINIELIEKFADIEDLSIRARTALKSPFFKEIVKRREEKGMPYTTEYVIRRTSSLDWSVLDLFYRLNGFAYFREMYRTAQDGIDEGPICNLGLITQYLSGFMEKYTTVITAAFLSDDKFIHTLFSSYTYALYRLDESEYEDKEEPIPKGRISFMTIHQSKGLEFPIVVVGSLDKRERSNIKEKIIRNLLQKKGEPINKIAKFDNMRMFYVALSRAKNLLVLPRIARTTKNAPRPDQMYATDEFKALLIQNEFTEIKDFDLDTLPECDGISEELGKTYSYTGDYLNYLQCPRQYMVFRKYGFVASRSQTKMFGTLVHQTIEDLHHLLIEERMKEVGE